MTVKVQCTHCKKSFRVDKKYAGQTVKCPFCPEAVDIPTDTMDSEPHHRVELRLEDSATTQDKEIAGIMTDTQRRLKMLERRAREQQQSVEHLVEGLLLDSEQVLHFAKPNWVVLASRMAVNLALFACLIVIDVFLLEPSQLRVTVFWVAVHLVMAGVLGYLMHFAWARTIYILTNLRVISRSGLISVTISSIPLTHLRAVSYKSNYLEKSAGLGSLKFYN